MAVSSLRSLGGNHPARHALSLLAAHNHTFFNPASCLGFVFTTASPKGASGTPLHFVSRKSGQSSERRMHGCVMKAAMVAVSTRRRNPMTSTLITASDLKDETTTELQSKFWNVAADISRMRQVVAELPLAEASLRNISNEIAARSYRYRTPKP
jgi:hypothetical protein